MPKNFEDGKIAPEGENGLRFEVFPNYVKILESGREYQNAIFDYSTLTPKAL